MRLIAFLLLWFALAPIAQASQHHLLIVSGIGGIDAYRDLFVRRAASLYQSALDAGIAADNITVLSATPMDNEIIAHRLSEKTELLAALEEMRARSADGDRLFIVLIGHGNPRNDGAAFNLPGPDISASELAGALDAIDNREIVVVNTASASGPFVNALSAPERVVITATSSGREYYATLFGDYFVAAFADSGADTDKDDRVSMLEAFAYARRETQREYDKEKQLATEHALLDDNGDGEGSREPGPYQADGALASRVYLEQPPTLALGASAELIALLERKQVLEDSINALKREREQLPRGDYYNRLEALLIELALLGRDIRAQGG